LQQLVQVLFGGTYGNLDNAKMTAQTEENRELIGGKFAGVINANNDLWIFKEDKSWEQIIVGREVPNARSFFGFTSMSKDRKTYMLFGGFSVKRLPELADTWRLTLNNPSGPGNTMKYTGTWTLVAPKGPSPSRRLGLGLVSSDDGFIHLFGGGVFDWTMIDDKTKTSLFRTGLHHQNLCFLHTRLHRFVKSNESH
jgi:hypothetical protein